MKPDGLPWKWIKSQRGEFITSFYAVAEARRNLAAEHHAALTNLLKDIELVPDAFGPPPLDVNLPAKDIPVFSTAAMSGADYLVTGDNDFSDYFGRTVHGVKIILPRMLKTELEHSSGQ